MLKHLRLIGLIILLALLLLVILEIKTPSLFSAEPSTAPLDLLPTPLGTGHIHVCPNPDDRANRLICQGGRIRGFVDGRGRRFIPNGLNPISAWQYRPNQSRTGLQEIGYDGWLKKLSQKGINSIHLRLDTGVGGRGALHMQGTPLGTYYIADQYPMEASWNQGWHYASYNRDAYAGALIDGEEFLTRYPHCRYPNFSEENCGPVYAAKFRESNLTRIIRAAEKYNVKLILTFWGSEQYYEEKRWAYSPYNQACRKPDGTPCSPAEAGLISNGYDIIFNPEGQIPGETRQGKTVLDYQRQYIDFVYQAWGESEAIWMWEIMNEIHFLAPWNSGEGELDDNVDQKLLPWVKYMANYLRARDDYHRPISISGIQISREDGVIADPRLVVSTEDNECDPNAWTGKQLHFFLACKHKMFDYVDVVNLHNYNAASLKGRASRQQQMEDIWPDKPKIIGEFLPGQCREEGCPRPREGDPIILEGQHLYIGHHPWQVEPAPFHNSVAYYWLHLIANGGNGEIRRWPGFGLELWQADALFPFQNEYELDHFSDVAVPTGRFIASVNWVDWEQHTHWEPYIRLFDTGLDPAQDFVLAARGDGNQVMLMFRSLNDEPTPIKIDHLEEGSYRVTLFDWLTGQPHQTQTVETESNSLIFSADVRWLEEDARDFTWQEEAGRFEGELIQTYTSRYEALDLPLQPASDWPRLLLSEPGPGHENDPINRLRRNIGVVLVERLE